MKVLIIEDDFDKRERLRKHVHEFYGDTVYVCEKESLRSGLKEIVTRSDYDILLLDMSMPSFDIGIDEPGGGTPESFAGKDLLTQMKLRGISIPTVVITQYHAFDDGSVTLQELTEEFRVKFKTFFVGSVYYNSAVDSWKQALNSLFSRMSKVP